MKKLMLLVVLTTGLMANQMWMCVAFSQVAWGGATSPNIVGAQNRALRYCVKNTPQELTCYQDIKTCKMVYVDVYGNPIEGWGEGTN